MHAPHRAKREPQRAPQGAAHHRREDLVALDLDRPDTGVATGRGQVPAHDVRGVAQRPPLRGEIQGEAFLFAGEEDDGIEPTRLEVRVAAHDGPARDEPQHAGARLTRTRPERGARHLGTHRVQHSGITDEQAPGEEPEVRVCIKKVSGPVEGAGLPPRVVVGEGDVRGPAGAHAVIARNRAAFRARRRTVTSGKACATQSGGFTLPQ